MPLRAAAAVGAIAGFGQAARSMGYCALAGLVGRRADELPLASEECLRAAGPLKAPRSGRFFGYNLFFAAKEKVINPRGAKHRAKPRRLLAPYCRYAIPH